MAEKIFKGAVKARIVEVRFAMAGKVVNVLKRRGDLVKKGELIAGLDKKILQMELDQQLADYEKKRADFEIFNLQKGEPQDDLTKYLKVGKQAELNSSVKEVELAKAKLDQTDLFSPIEGMVIDDGNCVAGMYITPASNPIKILNTTAYFFEIEIGQADIPLFLNPRQLTVKIPVLEKEILGNSGPIIPDENGKKFTVEISLQDTSNLLFGLEGEVCW